MCITDYVYYLFQASFIHQLSFKTSRNCPASIRTYLRISITCLSISNTYENFICNHQNMNIRLHLSRYLYILLKLCCQSPRVWYDSSWHHHKADNAKCLLTSILAPKCQHASPLELMLTSTWSSLLNLPSKFDRHTFSILSPPLTSMENGNTNIEYQCQQCEVWDKYYPWNNQHHSNYKFDITS